MTPCSTRSTNALVNAVASAADCGPPTPRRGSGPRRPTETGIRTADGTHREVDAVVLATGFRMAYDPAAYRDDTRVTGRDRFDLGTRFATERLKAYEGVTMPGCRPSSWRFAATAPSAAPGTR
jgi:cation diffusion facilitator CzcD-associated flavoprotein CzcO